MRSHTANQTLLNGGSGVGGSNMNTNNNTGGAMTDRRAFHPPTTGVNRPGNQTGGVHPGQHSSGLPGSATQHHPQRVPLQPHIIIDLSNDVRTTSAVRLEE